MTVKQMMFKIKICIGRTQSSIDQFSFRDGHLETFAVDDRRARFIVFLLGDPHLLEGGQ